ncbi:MAG: hypothetical protein Kow0065_09430 [Methylomicrobium sp.]
MVLSGCTSISKGVVEALLEKSETAEDKVCQITGSPVEGLDVLIDRKTGTTKVLMVHGVGDHLPGYSTQMLEKLAKALNLTRHLGEFKDIRLRHPQDNEQKLGHLRAWHLLNETGDRQLSFYELTWSEITHDQKSLLAFDNSGEHDFRRAKVNDLLKKFSNDTSPDPIIYMSQSRELILSAFAQAFCWMSAYDWQDLPDNIEQSCIGRFDDSAERALSDHYAFITHSLGSRITIDGLQRIAALLPTLNDRLPEHQRHISFTDRIEAFRRQRIPIFMLSNQLPLLQLGQPLPEVSEQINAYCQPTGDHYDKRMLGETALYAFSDPNDLLSYAIPKGFAERYIDSRLCPTVTNITINVANLIDAFGISNLANPLEAHTAYDHDDRVIAMIAHGVGSRDDAELVKTKCQFTRVLPAPSRQGREGAPGN